MAAKGLAGKLVVDVMGLAGYLCEVGAGVAVVAVGHVMGKYGGEAGFAARWLGDCKANSQ